MPAPEPHSRWRRAVRRAALVTATTGLVLGSPALAGAQTEPTLLTTTTTEPAETTTTTEAPATTTTTTTEAPATTTTDAPALTTTTAGVDDGVTEDDEVTDDRVIDGDADEGDGSDEVDPTSTTQRDLLVPGDGSEGAESTTTATTEPVEVAADTGLSEEAQIWLVVAGLVAVAVLIGAWTVRFWIRTRPERPDDGPDPTTVFPTR